MKLVARPFQRALPALLAAFVVGARAEDVPGTATPDTPPATAGQSPQPVGEPSFAVREFRITGSTLLDRREVERAVYPFLGDKRTFNDVDKARAALESLYKSHGYETVAVNIPEQTVAGGVVRLEVNERRIGTVRVKGARYFLPSDIRAEVEAAQAGTVPVLPRLKGEVAVLGRIMADRNVTPVLRAGQIPGTVDIDLLVRDQLPLHGSLELNNRYITDTPPLRLEGEIRYDNLWQAGHSLGLQFQTAPQETETLQVLSASYVVRTRTPGEAFVGFIVSSDSDVATLGSLNVVGNGAIYGGRAILPLAERPGRSLSAILGADYRRFDETVASLGSDLSNTPISYVPWVAQLSGGWSSARGNGRALAGVRFGIRGVGNDPQEFEDKRFGARPNFALLQAGYEQQLLLPADATIGLKLDGQVADSPLISNEQFAAGGLESVRGYTEAQALGDDGLRASLELGSPNFGRQLARAIEESRLYLFYDWGKLRIQQPLPGQLSDFRLSGAGVGYRMSAFKHLKLVADAAWALRDLSDVQSGDVRGDFSIEYRF